jgi:2,3-diketo-5-methylthio-1-phosphopentane phosphatase
MQIFCDFDGTISVKDTTDEILSRFALPQWEVIEEQWQQGLIGAAECMRQQIALIRASKTELDAALDSMPIDSHFADFVDFCDNIGAPLTIISDGVDYFIRRILARYNLGHLPIIANNLIINNANNYSLHCPHTNPTCTAAAGVCKCKKLKAHADLRVFVGDGRSDFCAAPAADVLFAKSTLARHCSKLNIAYNPYNNFADVQAVLKQMIEQQPYHESREYMRAIA